MLGRVQLLLLVFALVNAAGALVVVVGSGSQPSILYVAAVASPPALAFAWVSAYRRRTYDFLADCVTIGAVCLVAAAVTDRWFNEVVVLVTAAVFFSSAYGSLPRVLLRTGLISAVALGQAIDGPASLTTAGILAVEFLIVARLMYGLAGSMKRYEQTTRREQILAAAGLDLVASGDLPAIVASAIEGANALCVDLPEARVSLALTESRDAPPLRLKVLGSAGRRSAEMEGAVIAVRRLVAAGHELADQRLFRTVSPTGGADMTADADPARDPDADPAGDPAADPAAEARFLLGEILVTRVNVEGSVRGVLLIESPEPIPDELPRAIHALAAQVSLAISRMDLQSGVAERESTVRFQALILSSSDVIGIVSPDGSVRFMSPSLRQIFGSDPDAVLGSQFARLVHPDDEARFTLDLGGVVAEPGSTRVVECRLRHSDGSWRYAETRMTNLLDVPAIRGVVFNTRDVTERHNLEAELRHQAFHDSLTGLANRALFSNRVEHALVAAKRDGSIVAILYCDLDGMKRVNESLGYGAGDAVLKAVANRMCGRVRGRDTVARLGGNEFGLLLDRLTSTADATLAMERIMSMLRQPIVLPGAQVELQPHIGIAVSVGGDETAEDMLNHGAVAMRQARLDESGYALFDPEMYADGMRRIEVGSQLRTALDESQFVLHYQPTIDLSTGRLTGVEALVRWQHPKRGIVPPIEFIPLAEESGLIVPLGQWVIREACRQARAWQDEFPADEPIALHVNLSGRQLRHPNLVRDVADALDDSGLPSNRLVLEITESVLMTDTAATISRLYQLKSLGVKLAVDDFGTGYSSFAYLRRFPVDILKIDKSFVDGMATEATASALVDAMIRIAKALRLETVAEGVEKADQADRLRSLGCDMGQGFLFSRPLPSDEMTRLLSGRRVAGQPRADAA
ncbi:MAG: bifunctional diguanylate cyclase/phosphodiesterase [Candidatus Limnocylindrales bacterium]